MVGDFADDVEGLTCGIGWDADGDDGFLGIVEGQLGRSYLGLLPPTEMDGVTIGVGRAGGIQTDGLAGLGLEQQR